MERDKWRVDKCKCGRKIYYDPYSESHVTCGECKTKYKIDCDSILVYWLVEQIENNPWMTEAR
jgi:hypothetical protein